MVKDHKELVRVCGELNLNTLKDKIEVEYQKYLGGLQKIKNDALQWAKEIREQHEKMLADKTSGTLPPRTPTLKRPQRKRKIPDNDGKENSIAVGRKVRAASQAASSKFYGQFHVPLKLRRPSEESKKQPPKRVRIASSTVDSDDDAVSVATSTVSEKVKTKTPPRKLRSKRQAPVVEESSDEDGEDVEMENNKPKMKTRSKKTKNTSPANKKPEKKLPKKRKIAKKVDSDSEDTPNPPETTNENIPSDIASTEAELSQEDAAVKTPEEQPIKKNPKLVMSRIVAIKMEKLSATFISIQTNSGQQQEDFEDPQALPAEPDVVSSGSQSEAEHANVEVAKEITPEKRRSSRNKPMIKLPGKTPELQALTPHITGKVKERVKAVEQSLQKGYPRVHADAATLSRVSPLKQSRLLKHTQDSHPGTSPDPFAGDSDDESNHSISNLRRKSAQTAKKTISASMTNLTMTGTMQKMATLNGQVSVTKKLFEPSSSMRHRRSKSYDFSMKKESHHSHCCSSQSRPVQGTNTLGRSRVVGGKTFITQAAKEQAQHLAQEAERKKEEERQLREEKLNEAAKKKEEILKSRAEEKKKANEEKRNKVKHMQEQRQKDMEAQQQRKKEETTRLEKEREEQKRVKDKDDKAQKLLELRAKRLEKKKLEDAKKAKEEELKKAKEEELRKSKEEEAKKAKEEEEELKKLQAKKAVEASKQKMLLMAKTLKPINEAVKSAPVLQALNSTFTKPTDNECKTPKAVNPAVSRLAQNDSYVVTPSKDELPPPLPKTDNDYGIDEVTEGDSSDDDEKPKKKVPSWASKMRGNPQLDCADYVRIVVRNNLFGTRVFKPTITDLFGENARPMNRRSSAVWNTPPNLHHMTLNASMLMD